jgi:hypothetical protein
MAKSAAKKAPPAPVPISEVGAAKVGEIGDWYASLLEEKVPELRWPSAYDTYDDMANNPQIASVLQAVILPILGAQCRVDGTGCRPDITRHVANDLGLPVVGEGDTAESELPVEDRSLWEEHAEIALEEFVKYGHSFWEQKAEQDAKGLWHLAKLAYRPPRTISKINTARDGGLVSIEQNAGSSGFGFGSIGPKVLEVWRIVVYSRARRGANWRGRSLLRPAYMPWLLNNRAARVEMILAERAGAPLTVYTGAENEASLAAGQKIATEARAGQNAGAAVAYGATLKQQGIEGELPDIDKIKRYNDEMIARAVLMHLLNLGTQTGSWALGSTFEDVMRSGITAVAKAFARTATRHVAADIVGWNWPGERAPKLVFDEIGAQQGAIVQAIAILVQAKVLQPDEDLEQFLRTALGLPPRGRVIETQEAP